MDSILIVDDIEINRLILRDMLESDYELLEAENGIEALDILFNISKLPKAVLLDIMMPEMDGFEVLRRLKEKPATAQIPILFITASNAGVNEMRGLQEGAVDYISKPFNPHAVRARINNHIQLQNYKNNLEAMLEQKTEELVAAHEHMLETLASIIEYRSLESGQHIRRTVELTRIVVEHLLKEKAFPGVLTPRFAKSIVKTVALHDVGKIGIPDNILLKPGKLTPEEFEVIKTHTTIGGDIIQSIARGMPDEADYIGTARDICRSHHERWDGKGYPEGLSGVDIPLSARILSVVDVYDAVVSARCYKPANSHEETLRIIEQGKGTQFDAEIVDAFMEVSDQIHAYTLTEQS